MKNPIIKTVALTLSVGAILLSTGCSSKNNLVPIEDVNPNLVPIAQVEAKTYTAYGRYYTDGNVITNNGSDALRWEYSTDLISNREPYDGMPVWIAFSDNGTSNIIKDDEILGLVFDRNTAIYDELEEELSEEFVIERDGNKITIKGEK